jgi:hypothetical protein
MMRILGGLGIWSKCVDFDVLNNFMDTWVSFFFFLKYVIWSLEVD